VAAGLVGEAGLVSVASGVSVGVKDGGGVLVKVGKGVWLGGGVIDGNPAGVGDISAAGGSAVHVGGTGIWPVGSLDVAVGDGRGVTEEAKLIRVGKSDELIMSPPMP